LAFKKLLEPTGPSDRRSCANLADAAGQFINHSIHEGSRSAPSASLRRLDMQNARRLPKLSTNSRSFEFPFDVTASHAGRWLSRTRASTGNVVDLEAIGVCDVVQAMD